MGYFNKNWHYWLKKLLKRPTCELESTTRLFSSSRIRNAHGKNSFICIGKHTLIKGELLTFGHGGEIVIGDYCYIGEGSRIWSAKYILIGSKTLISHNVNIMDNLTHSMSPCKRHEQFKSIINGHFPLEDDLSEAPIHIGDNVLIGCHSIILRGVNIGEGAVVGAGSVVTKDVPPWTIVAGNPARVMRELTLEERQS